MVTLGMTGRRAPLWDYTAAVQHVGDTPERQALWLFQFAAGDLSEQSTSELRAFLELRLLRNLATRRRRALPAAVQPQYVGLPRVGLTAETAAEIHRTLRERLATLKRTG